MNKEKIYTKLTAMIAERPAYAAGAGILLLVILIMTLSGSCNSDRTDANAPLYTIESGPLAISVTQTGTLQNKNRIVIKSQVPKRLAIVWLRPEGEMVKKDDLLIELDKTELEDNSITMQIAVENGEASLIQAKENLAIAKNQAEADVEKAELDYKFSKLALEKYIKGTHPQNLETTEADIIIAKENLQIAEDDLSWSSQLHKKGFITRTELRADELSVKQKTITAKLRRSNKDVYTKYTYPMDLESLESSVGQAEMALERTKRKAKANVIKAEATVRAQQSEYDQRKKKLDEQLENIANCRIAAPAAGMIVYAGGDGHPWRRNRDPLDVGVEVSPKQELFYLPTSDEMLALISVQEASRPKLKEDMPAVIKIDAFANRLLSGKLTKIGILPDSTQAWLNPDLKVYKCEVLVDPTDLKMRPGMNCQVEIVIEEYSDAMYVPLQCVIQVNGKPTVFLKKRMGAIEQRTVDLGLNNNRVVHIKSGLAEGDKVLLEPPLEAGTKNNNGSRRTSRPAEKKKPAENTGKPDKKDMK